MKYERGDKVWWWSEQSPAKSKAVFVRYDKDFPKEDGIFAFRIGKDTVQTFRWPLRLTKKV